MVKHLVAIIFSMILSNLTCAAGTEKNCNKADWSCHGSFYLTGGYVFVHTFFNDNQLSLSPPEQPKINFTPQDAFPNNGNGMRWGFGSGFGGKLPFTYELDYNQIFTHSKTKDGLKISRSSKSLVAIIGYTLNPKNRLRASLVGGASVISTYLTATTVAPREFFSQNTNSVDVDPFLGGSLSYQINSRFALRAVEFYDFATYNRSAKGAAVTLLMLNYYPE
ncbi:MULTISPECIES: hypothetical protein [Legionella]|uniref:Outer membrane protein beta-barrel domain-containing protein n=1 Tax=Legionella resiliens TaxID=2905958 RepID=A0ABS8WZF8_9GAMM|nr:MULTISPECIES: hypothetical protein [unclassified Legionella]MCE0721762.1 hypothetical protein [Legionella sp. 9fVS26]MCE3530916.1 hypothetical protein [Legionella sp. 8cVS16]QLZ70478.1 hypothetical protein FOLKNPGA_03292 [Legionella sp. PC1000]